MPTPFVRSLFLGSVVALSAVGAARCGVFMHSHPIPGVPEITADALTDKWPGWQLAPAASAACAGAMTGPVITGDFDGDGVQDLAVMITVKGAPHLAVVLGREAAPVPHELELPAGGAIPALALHKRGTRYRTTAMTVSDYLVADALATDTCGATGEMWLWMGDNFQRMPLAK